MAAMTVGAGGSTCCTCWGACGSRGALGAPRGYESTGVDYVVPTRPRRLRVEVRPASSLGGEPWLVRVVRLTAGAVSEAGSSATDSTGAALFTDLASDRHLVTVEAAGQRWASAEIDVVDREQVLDVDVPALRVEGHVYLGDEPLRHATVIFGGSSGLDSVTFHADASGAFSGHLPRPGDWAVVISADSPPVERSLRRVSVAIRPRKAYAEVEIRLPGGRLHGGHDEAGGALVLGVEPGAAGDEFDAVREGAGLVVEDGPGPSRRGGEARGREQEARRLQGEAFLRLPGRGARAAVEVGHVQHQELPTPLLVKRLGLVPPGNPSNQPWTR